MTTKLDTKLKIGFMWLLHKLPLMHISCDKIFGDYEYSLPARFSFFKLSLGDNKHYLITWGNEFKFYYRLKFSEVEKIKTNKELMDKTDSYASLIDDRNKEEIDTNIDFLKHKISSGQSRISSGYNKTNQYTTIALVYLGFLVYLVDSILEVKPSISEAILLYSLISISMYYILNSFLFIRFALKVKGYTRSTFGDIKNNPNQTKLASLYYLDWLSTNNESQIITSIVLNIEKYFFRSLVTSIITLGLIFTLSHSSKYDTGTQNHNKGEYLIYDSAGNFNKTELIGFLNQFDQNTGVIYIIKNKANDNGDSILSFIKSIALNQSQIIVADCQSLSKKYDQVLEKFYRIHGYN